MTCYLRVITEESVLKEIFQVIDIVDLTPILRENILHANCWQAATSYRAGDP